MHYPTFGHFNDLFWNVHGNEDWYCPTRPSICEYSVTYQDPVTGNMLEAKLPVKAYDWENCFQVWPKISDAWKTFCKEKNLDPDKVHVNMNAFFRFQKPLPANA